MSDALDFHRSPSFGPDPQTFLVDPRDVSVEFLSDPDRNEVLWVNLWDARSGELLLRLDAQAEADDRIVFIHDD